MGGYRVVKTSCLEDYRGNRPLTKRLDSSFNDDQHPRLVATFLWQPV